MIVSRASVRRLQLSALAALIACLGAAGVWHDATAAQTPTSCPARVALVNGSFEAPVVPSGKFSQLKAATVPGWSTTASDNLVELWPRNFKGVKPPHGQQVAELNATQPSTLYQDLPTTPGQRLFWRLRHRGRDGRDTMALRIGPSGGPLVTIQEMTDGIGGALGTFGSYTGTYDVPPGQTLSRFAFTAVSSADANLSEGNLLDDIFFGTPPCVIVSKSVTPSGPVSPGTVLTYQLTTRNEGGDVAESVVLSDTIPVGATYEANSLRILNGSAAGVKTDAADGDEASFDGTKVIFALGDNDAPTGIRRLRNVAGEPTGVTVEFKVRAGAAATQITNASTVTYTNQLASPAETLTSTSNDVVTTVTPIVDLSITKRDLVDPAPVGGTVTYVLDVLNAGPNPATGVIVNDALPLALTFVSATPSQGTCTAGPSCNLGTLAANGTATVTIVATATSAGELTNSATVSANERDGNVANNQDSETTVIFAEANLQLTKNASATNILVGGSLTYTMTVTNLGPSPATSVILTDKLPTRLQFVSATPTQGSCTGATAISCALGQLAPGGSATVTVATLGASVGQAVNNALVSATEPDPNPGNNSASTSVVVGTPPPSAADLRIAKTGPGGTVRSGAVGRFVLTVTNDGPDTATDVRVVDTLPTGFVLVSATPSQGGACTSTAGLVTCPIGTLAPGQSASVTVDARTGAPRAAVNGAFAEAAETDPDPGNNSAEVEVVVLPVVDLELTKAAIIPEVRPGDDATFRLTVNNRSDAPALNVIVTDFIPSNATFISATPSQGGPCTLAGQQLSCPLTSMSARGSATITIILRTTTVGTLVNQAVVRGDEQDAAAINNVATATVTVSDNPEAAQADLVVQKSVSPSAAAAGDSVTFAIAIRNNGPDAATGVVLDDVLPVGLSVQSITSSQGACTSGRPSRCTLGSLDAGAQATVQVTTRISGSGEHANVSIAGADQADPDTTNNRATAVLTVDADVPTPSPESDPEPSSTKPDDDDDDDQKLELTEEERQQRQRTNRSNRDDEHTEGHVVGVRCTIDQPIPELKSGFISVPEETPYAVIAMRDGMQQVRLTHDARLICNSLRIGDYLEADGTKQHEQLFDADDAKVHRARP